MLSCSICFSASSFWMGGSLESRCVGRVYGSNQVVRMRGGIERCCVGRVYGVNGAWHHPHRTHDLRSGSQDHHPSKNSVQKTICCNSTSDAPDDGRMYPKHVELRIHQQNYLVASSWNFKLFHIKW
jgi:hypothetical protein